MNASIDFPPEFTDQLACRVAERLAEVVVSPAEPYLDVEQAAEYLACDKDRIYDLKALGRLRHVRDGRRLLFRREWLDAALDTS